MYPSISRHTGRTCNVGKMGLNASGVDKELNISVKIPKHSVVAIVVPILLYQLGCSFSVQPSKVTPIDNLNISVVSHHAPVQPDVLASDDKKALRNDTHLNHRDEPEWRNVGRWMLEASARHVLPQILRAWTSGPFQHLPLPIQPAY